jgi:hypothetical protein
MGFCSRGNAPCGALIKKKDFPILEFDSISRAKIEPSEVIKKRNVPEHCIITFFSDAINRILLNCINI